MILTKFEALKSLCPTSKFVMSQEGVILNSKLKNGEKLPTEEQIQAKLAELQADYDAKQYQRDRASQYPSITDVVVALAEKEEGNDAMWQEITAQRAKVKADNPKP